MKKLVPVYPWPVPAKAQAILDTIPDINVVQAQPGGPVPILSLSVVPPFVTDAIVVKAPEYLEAAVRIVASNGIELHTTRDLMGRYLGKDLGFERLENGPAAVSVGVHFE